MQADKSITANGFALSFLCYPCNKNILGQESYYRAVSKGAV